MYGMNGWNKEIPGGDLISRAEALNALSRGSGCGTSCHRAIKALPSVRPEKRTNECTETHACDCISRQAAIDALDVLCQEHRYRIPGKRETYSQYNEAWQDALDRAEGAIFNLPSAQPERKKGKWIEEDDGWDGVYWRCSECDGAFCLVDGTPKENEYNFCPNCGADMRGEDDE